MKVVLNMEDKLCSVLYNGEDIIGYVWDVVPFLEDMIKDLLDRLLRDDIDSEFFNYMACELKSTIDILNKNDEDYNLINVKECAMGGFKIIKLEEV